MEWVKLWQCSIDMEIKYCILEKKYFIFKLKQILVPQNRLFSTKQQWIHMFSNHTSNIYCFKPEVSLNICSSSLYGIYIFIHCYQTQWLRLLHKQHIFVHIRKLQNWTKSVFAIWTSGIGISTELHAQNRAELNKIHRKGNQHFQNSGFTLFIREKHKHSDELAKKGREQLYKSTFKHGQYSNNLSVDSLSM